MSSWRWRVDDRGTCDFCGAEDRNLSEVQPCGSYDTAFICYKCWRRPHPPCPEEAAA